MSRIRICADSAGGGGDYSSAPGGSSVSSARSIESLLVAVASGGAIVLFGALYALLLALGRLQGRASLRVFAYLAYLSLAASTIVLVRAIELNGLWLALPAVLLAAYLFAPHAVWRLCVGIEGESRESAPRPTRGGSP